MIDYFLPYTAFQYASAIRAIQAEIWRPQEVAIYHGAGTTDTQSGKLYFQAFVAALEERGISHTLQTTSVLGYIRGIFNLSKGRFVTGNLRRVASLFLGSRAREVILLDDGLGSVLPTSYLSPKMPERSKAKRIANTLRILPRYTKVCGKIALNPTVFPDSIFPNAVVMPFTPAIVKQRDQIANQPDCIFISSYLTDVQMDNYIAWVKENFTYPQQTLLAIHPQMPEQRAQWLSESLGAEILETEGLLIEEYIVALENKSVKVIAQHNTSTLILQQLGFAELEIASYTA